MPAAPPSAPTSCCCPASEDRDIWRYFATASMPRQDQADAVLAALAAARPADVDGRPRDRHRRPAHPARAAAQGARRRRRRAAGVRRLGRRPAGRGSYDAERYARVAGARDAEAASMLAYERTTAAGCASSPRRSTTRARSRLRPLRPLRRRLVPGRTCPTPRGRRRRQRLRRVGVEIAPRAQWPTGMDRLGVPVQRADRRRRSRSAAAAPSPGSPTSAGAAGCAPCSPPARRTHRRRRRAAGGLRRRPPQLGLGAAAGRRRRGAEPAARRSSSVRSPRHLARIGRLPWLGPLALVDGGPSGEPGGNSAFRLAGVWDRLDAGPDVREGLAALARDRPRRCCSS